ncbi:GIY-YIG nuclease family protein [candidate division WS5 bacterium]|uniref:GIY-YIG nuclease family protein n=1 Tax=candidate division WS5 bacterium TaxID=2093353 RepID=A0A419DA95_9BACT|nr:MAG: GIY-YIG nuclease family protein [candidate division WS5 bacterium]
MKNYYIYIMASESGTLYVGVTNDLKRRVYEHRKNLIEGFTKKYNCHKLVYFEQTPNVESAIGREKQIKKWSRKKKEDLIKTRNLSWKDLFEEI